MRLLFLTLLLILTLDAKERVIHVYNWSEYLPEEILKAFTKETHIKVIYTTYESNEEMYDTLKSSKTPPYDVVVPSTYYISKMAREGMLETIDKEKLSNYYNLDYKLLSQPFDPDNNHSIPYLWGSTGITYNASLIDEVITSWAELWNPLYQNSELIHDDMREVFGVALKVLGYSANSTDPHEIEAAYHKLQELKPNIKLFSSESQSDIYLKEEVKLGMNFNGEGFLANQKSFDLQYVYPKEGALVWMDSLVIPKGAKHLDNAHVFIDYLLRPEVAKTISEEIGYATPNAEAIKLLDEETRDNYIVYPSKRNLNNSEMQVDVGEALPIYEKYWEALQGEGEEANASL